MTIAKANRYQLGYSGIGKLPIPQEIQKLMLAILVDNHLFSPCPACCVDPGGSTA